MLKTNSNMKIGASSIKLINNKVNESTMSMRSSLSKGIKFENYSPRKDILKTRYNDILCYKDFDERKVTGIMFDKVAKRNTDTFLISSLKKCPSVGTYNPKFTSITNKPFIVSKIFRLYY